MRKYLLLFIFIFSFIFIQSGYSYADDCVTPRERHQDLINQEILKQVSDISKNATVQGISKSLKDIDGMYGCSMESIQTILNTWNDISSMSGFFNLDKLKELGASVLQNAMREAISQGCDYVDNSINKILHDQNIEKGFSVVNTMKGYSTHSTLASKLNVITSNTINKLYNRKFP